MVGEAVEHGLGEGLVAEDPGPFIIQGPESSRNTGISRGAVLEGKVKARSGVLWLVVSRGRYRWVGVNRNVDPCRAGLNRGWGPPVK